MIYNDHDSIAVSSVGLRLLLELDSEGYLNHVGTVLSFAPAPANLGSADVIKTGAFSKIGARDKLERPSPSAFGSADGHEEYTLAHLAGIGRTWPSLVLPREPC